MSVGKHSWKWAGMLAVTFIVLLLSSQLLSGGTMAGTDQQSKDTKTKSTDKEESTKADKPLPPGLEKKLEELEELAIMKELPEPKDLTREELLDAIRKQPGGNEKVEMALSGKPGKSADNVMPPGLAKKLEELEELASMKELPEPKGLTKEELLDAIRKQPGGKEKIEKAKKDGAKIGMETLEGETFLSALFDLNPLWPTEAMAGTSFPVDLYESNGFSTSDRSMYVMLWDVDYSYHSWKVKSVSTTALRIIPPETGWYTITFMFRSDERVPFDIRALKQGGGAESSDHEVYDHWRYVSYPALVYLGARRTEYIVFSCDTSTGITSGAGYFNNCRIDKL
jgi:hypothetical protein